LPGYGVGIFEMAKVSTPAKAGAGGGVQKRPHHEPSKRGKVAQVGE
jgi:hypothetical protein